MKHLKGFLLFGCAVAIPFFISIFFWGPEIFAWLFGKAWEISGTYAKSLVISYSILLIVSPMGQMLIALQKIKTNSLWEIAKFAIIASLFFVKFSSIGSYLYNYNLLLIMIYSAYLVVIVRVILRYERSIK